MCGIFGEYSLDGQSSDLEILHRLNDLNFLRGPDSGGHWNESPGLYFGFRRLAILDLRSLANQPMVSHDRQWVMVFNGEVYNHKEIRAQIPDGVFQFKTHSDTESILCAFQYFGIEKTVEMLDGMFAVALYHIPSGTLRLIRDFAGIKPVWYGWNGRKLVFGSQFDQIRRHPSFFDEPINEDVLGLYLRYSYVPAPFGLHQNTYQLRPGEMLTLEKDGTIKKEMYFTYPAYHPIQETKTEAMERVDSALAKAVKQELESDVPLGAFLSGGIDSPLVTSYASTLTNGKLKAFSIGSDSQVHDESEDAQYYAQKTGVEHHLDRMNASSALGILDQVMEANREPLADFSVIPTYLVCRHARKQVTVALSGDGGDELFYGYERFWAILKNYSYRNIPGMLKYPIYAADKLLFKSAHINSNFIYGSYAEAHEALHEHTRPSQLNRMAPHIFSKAKPKDWDVYMPSEIGNEKEEVWKLAQSEYYGMMQKTLAKVDRMSMANSLEVRVPFLLKSFMQTAWTVDPEFSYGQNKRKQLLKDLLKLKMGELPRSDIKRGFSVPLSDWLRKDLKENVMDLTLSETFVGRFGFVRSEIEKIWNDHLQKKGDHKWALFTLYALAEWDERHNNPLK